MLAEQFTQTFREEHRKVRDGLLDLIEAFRKKDKPRIQSLLGEIAAFVGPHFRYEEEALYPALVDIFGSEYIEELLGDHDAAIGIAKRLVELASKDTLSDEDVEEAVRLIRRILPHVSDCDRLSIMTEKLPEEKLQKVFEIRERAFTEGFDLLKWAEEVRQRPVQMPA